MAFRKVSAKEWVKMGLPSSVWTISFGVSKKKEIKKPTFVLKSNTPKKKK